MNTTNILQLLLSSVPSPLSLKKELWSKTFRRFGNLNGITVCPSYISEATQNFTVQDAIQVLHSVTEIRSP